MSNNDAAERTKAKDLTEVWGDTVSLKELGYASILGFVLTMVFFLMGRTYFLGLGTIETSLAKGYSLLVGMGGCILSAVISARLFRPKRKIEEHMDTASIEEILASAGMTLEDEIAGLSALDPKVIREMEELELWQLLALIPEDSKNYKPEYKKLAESKSGAKEG